MSVRVVITCEAELCCGPSDGDGCRTSQEAFFDARSETWGDMLDAVTGQGWRFDGDVTPTGVRCPRCAAW